MCVTLKAHFLYFLFSVLSLISLDARNVRVIYRTSLYKIITTGKWLYVHAKRIYIFTTQVHLEFTTVFSVYNG